MSSAKIFWLCLGFTGQTVFMARFVVQWIASERQGESVMPTAFWYLSLIGSWMLLAYAIHLEDPVIIFGQLFGTTVYVRNLALLRKTRMKELAEKKKPGLSANPSARKAA